MFKEVLGIIYLILYMLFWIVLCEFLSLETFTIGLVICFLVYLFNVNNFRLKIKLNKTHIYIFYCIRYITVLVIDIIKSNYIVAKYVLNRNLNINPQFISMKTRLNSDFQKAMLANSITLTPGTLTVLMKNNDLLVHCLDGSSYNMNYLQIEKILLKMED